MSRQVTPPLNSRNIIVSLCDYSGVWSDPYKRAGYEVMKIDLKLGGDAILFPSMMSETPRLPRQFADIRELIGRVHGVLAAPVCTVFTGSGARWPRSDDDIRGGLALVDACVRIAWVLKPDFWALENPVGKLPRWLGDPLLTFQPNYYGDPYTKATCLYGDFNTDLPRNHVEATEGSKMWASYGGKSERTKELRSTTPQGFANAFYEANP